MKKYLEFIQTAQNSLTLYGEAKKAVTIKTLPSIARYFEGRMKIFLPS